jgi:hypothetical protein
LNALALAIFLVLMASLILTACGGSNPKLLSGTTANQITANLEEVRSLASEEDCIGAENAAAAVGEEIEALEGVDAKLKQALVQGAERLEAVVGECDESALRAAEEEREAEEAEQAAEEEQEEEKEAEREGKQGKAEKNGQEKEAEEKEEAPAGGNEGGGQPGKGEEGGGGEEEEPPAEEGSSGGISPGAPVGEG